MVMTARARPATAGAAARPTARMAARPAAHAATLSTREVTRSQLSQLILQGVSIAAAILVVIGGIVYFFGDTLRGHLMPLATPASAPTAAAGPAPTIFYRDRGDGTVTVMEIDANGSTRIKGSISRNDVPLLQADKVREGWGGSGTPSPHSRVNALGSSFR